MSGADICFLATSKSGLGHLRRSATIARALKSRAPDRKLHLVSNASPLGMSDADMAAFDSIRVQERSQMASAAALTGSGVVVLDTISVPGIESFGLPLALVLRETPDSQLHRFQLAEAKPWDLVIIANPEDHWMPQTAVLRTRCMTAVGWIYRSPGLREAVPTSPPTVLVATGGGGTAETAGALYGTINAVLTRLRQQTPAFKVVQAIGPRASGFGQLPVADKIIDPGAALDLLFRDADLVISTAGYNSVLELAVTDTPTLLAPIPRSIDDQTARARFWGPLLGAWYEESAPLAAADWLSQQIASPVRRPPVKLGPSGEDRAAEAILRLG